MNTKQEVNLVQQIARGDEAAFNEIYHRFRHRIYGFTYRMTINRAIAEDITHETFLVLIKHPERFSADRGSLMTFFCAVARNFVMNHLRRKHNEDVGFDQFEEFDVPDNGTQGNPLAELLNQEFASRVETCIAALPPLQREAIILREYEELSYEEIARVTDAELSAVKSRLHRARQTLAGDLAAYVASPRRDNCYELH